jgi:multidrug efflux pump subunit AcrA (membrane-fusion protein)
LREATEVRFVGYGSGEDGPAVQRTVVTRHKYITIGTKILGQIVEEPIEEGQHIKAGDVLARIDDRDYQAQLRQAIAIRDVAEANLHLLQDKADRARYLIKTGAISTDDFETAITAAQVAQAELGKSSNPQN